MEEGSPKSKKSVLGFVLTGVFLAAMIFFFLREDIARSDMDLRFTKRALAAAVTQSAVVPALASTFVFAAACLALPFTRRPEPFYAAVFLAAALGAYNLLTGFLQSISYYSAGGPQRVLTSAALLIWGMLLLAAGRRKTG